MKFLILGDLHGKEPKLFYKDFDVIIAPGDFCSDGIKKYIFMAFKESIRTSSRIEWYDLVGKNKAREMIENSIFNGRKVLEKLNSFKVPVYIVPGNWDWTPENSEWSFLRKNHYKSIIKGLNNIKDVHGKLLNIEGYSLIGYGITSGPEYPVYAEDAKMYNKKELKAIMKNYESIYLKVLSLFEMASNPVIFLSHNVPFNSRLDMIRNKESPRNGYHYGSLIVKEMINKYQPLVNIAGHMHENFGKCRIGKTLCINSGHGNNINTYLEIEKNKVKRLEFHK